VRHPGVHEKRYCVLAAVLTARKIDRRTMHNTRRYNNCSKGVLYIYIYLLIYFITTLYIMTIIRYLNYCCRTNRGSRETQKWNQKTHVHANDENRMWIWFRKIIRVLHRNLKYYLSFFKKTTSDFTSFFSLLSKKLLF